MPRYSYSSATNGLWDRVSELGHLARTLPRTTRSTVDYVRRIHEETVSRVFEATGVWLEGKKGLDIGPGQQLGCLRCFSLKNDVVGIDTDVIPRGFDLGAYAEVLGVDARFASELARELGIEKVPPVNVLQMNATQMTFEPNAFDFVYTHSVFEHIDDPAAALREVVRVLRPGGAAYVSVHLYTSHSGSHDPKIFADGAPRAPYWPHLRPAFMGDVRPSTFLNRLSLRAWQQLFESVMPGVHFIPIRQDAELAEPLRALRAEGELAAYEDDELLTVDLVAVWKKPRAEEIPSSKGARRRAQRGAAEQPC